MGMDKFHRFDVEFETAFPRGLVLNGEIEPDNEFQENRQAPPRQKVDEQTGKRMWKGVFSDPAHVKEAEASVKVTFLADQQPVPTSEEFVPGCGMRPVVLEGLEVTPRVTGQDKFKKLGWAYFATGFAEAAGGTPPATGSGAAAGAASNGKGRARSGESDAAEASAGAA